MRMVVMMAALGLASPVVAQEGQRKEVCPSTAPALPPELAGWSKSISRTAATTAGTAARASLPLGQAAQLRLTPTPGVRFAIRPEKSGPPASNGGLASFTVTRPGIYRVTLGSGAWVDVVRDGKASASIAHGHGPACSSIRKMVDFRLMPGRYLLQVAGNADPVIPVMVAALR